MVKKKQEALTVNRLINEVLVGQLGIPLRQIVNDTSFEKYTGSKRPDLLISEFEYDSVRKNDDQFINNLVAYAEAKDDCPIDSFDWLDAIKQGSIKAPKLNLPYFIVTNGKTSIFYNAKTENEIKLNGNPIREFQTIDIFRLIKKQLSKNPELDNIITNIDSISVISEAIFNKKLWELAKVYRNINFDNNAQKIDFTIGFISLEYFEERETTKGVKDTTKIYWSDCSDHSTNYPSEKIVASLSRYIERLEQESQFGEFVDLMEKVHIAIAGKGTTKSLVSHDEVKQIYELIDSMKPLHGCGFDLFGAVYEMFASSKEKKEFGQYFTRRHYTHVLSKILLRNEQYYDKNRKFKILDLACGTGGFLTEGFSVLRSAYAKSNTLTPEAEKFLEDECFYGIDVTKENISRTKLNMFLVGDGHTNMEDTNTLTKKFGNEEQWDYILTNPPVGAGTIKAETSVIMSNRTEVCFLYKAINLLKDGGKVCILLPDGILENSTFSKLRKDILEKCAIEAIISLPKFAFAPYTKEKMYALFLTKKNKAVTRIQKEPIWMYIIDNDGLANSDKRFPTKLRNNRNGWLHDEISGWVSTDGEEMIGLLEEHWLKYDDSQTGGTTFQTDKGEVLTLRKAGFINASAINKSNHYHLLPEFYLRKQSPNYIDIDGLQLELQGIKAEVAKICNVE